MYFYAHLSFITFSNWSIFTDISFLWQMYTNIQKLLHELHPNVFH